MAGQRFRIQVNRPPTEDAAGSLVEGAVATTLADAGVAEGEISLTFLDDAGMVQLNRTYLDREGPTDVIAFSLGEKDAPLGDVYVGLEQARRQAEDHGVSLREELVRLAVHGTLHVLGHDHPDGPDRIDSPMFRLQEALVRRVLESGSSPSTEGAP
jgi:probable rRNA maturation factor